MSSAETIAYYASAYVDPRLFEDALVVDVSDDGERKQSPKPARPKMTKRQRIELLEACGIVFGKADEALAELEYEKLVDEAKAANYARGRRAKIRAATAIRLLYRSSSRPSAK